MIKCFKEYLKFIVSRETIYISLRLSLFLNTLNFQYPVL